MPDPFRFARCARELSGSAMGIIAALLLLCALLAGAPPCTAEEANSPAAPASNDHASSSPEKSSSTAADTKSKPATGTSVNDCAGGEYFKGRAASGNSPAIVYNGNLVPAGNSVDFGVTTPIDPDAHYFAIIFHGDDVPIDNDSHAARARKAAATDDLVVKHLLAQDQTIVSVDVPAEAAGFWTKQNLYIYQCRDRRPINVSYLPVYLSPRASSIALTLLIGLAVYYAAAQTLQRRSKHKLVGLQGWNPIRITADPEDGGSLSTFQVFFFSLLVFVMLTFVLMRTGVLADLSTTVLQLLGISGIGAAAAKGTDASKEALDPANRAWLLNKGWLGGPSVRSAVEPTFFDLISTDGNFDVYRFQSLLFSAAVGGALFIGGVSQLSSFTVPENILGILGLSQVVYIAGKLVTGNSASQLNALIADVRSAEAEFREVALSYRPSPDAAIATAPATLDEAITRVGNAAYARYLEKAKAAARLFTSITGLIVEGDKLKPSLGVA